MADRFQPHAGTISTGGGYLFRRTTQNNVLHAGVDIAAQRGTVVHAPATGTVVSVERADRSPFKGYGPQSVTLRDDEGVFHLLAHLEPDSLPDPRDQGHLATPVDGLRFQAGQPIGRVGKFGHTHWELRTKFLKGDPMDDNLVRANTLDPMAWLSDTAHYNVVIPTPIVVSQPRPSSPSSAPAKPSGGGLWILLALMILSRD